MFINQLVSYLLLFFSFLVLYILADLISFLKIQRLQLAGSSSTVFAVNLILYYSVTFAVKEDIIMFSVTLIFSASGLRHELILCSLEEGCGCTQASFWATPVNWKWTLIFAILGRDLDQIFGQIVYLKEKTCLGHIPIKLFLRDIGGGGGWYSIYPWVREMRPSPTYVYPDPV